MVLRKVDGRCQPLQLSSHDFVVDELLILASLLGDSDVLGSTVLLFQSPRSAASGFGRVLIPTAQ